MDTYKATYYSFEDSPLSDACWSLHAGPDGRVYAAACVEHSPGGTATIVRYNEENDALDSLFDMDKVTGDFRDSGRATQCKIHYSFVPEASTGLLYGATHLSGPPKDREYYDAWAGWHDETKGFRGAYLIAYDTNAEEIVRSELMIPREGCRCLCLDEERRMFYAVTYPRDHFISYDLERKELTDLGRIGSVNSQCIFLDAQHRPYLTDDRGIFVRYDPGKGRLEELPLKVPRAWHQNGWHGVLYDAVKDCDAGCIYGVCWMVAPRLFRYWPDEGDYGTLEDLGRVTQEPDRRHPVSMSLEHVGGLVFGCDNCLYYGKARWEPGTEKRADFRNLTSAEGVIVRMEPETLEHTEVCTLHRPDGSASYVSRGARDRNGDLYFGHVGNVPVGLFRVQVPDNCRNTEGRGHLPLRTWG